MVIPPIKNPVVPGTDPGEISKGHKVSIADLTNIANGGLPGELFAIATMDESVMPAVPDGMHRVVQKVFAWSEEQDSELVLGIRRLGVDYYLKFANEEDIATIGADAVTYTAYIYPALSDGRFIMKPGDILFAQDFIAAGGDVYLHVMYVDVFF